MQPVLLALDVGTTVAKAVLFDLDGRERTVAEYGYRLLTPPVPVGPASDLGPGQQFSF